jgi:hypothetical protein
MLMERRTTADLEDLLAERLALLRTGRIGVREPAPVSRKPTRKSA